MYSALYVDDERDLLDITKLFLESSQEFSVDTTDSAEEGLKVLRQRHYDAIISDYQMPGMDGIAFLKAVRSSHGDIPFIIFTGRGREEIVIEALNNGADFYLQKGGDPEVLYTELTHVIRRTIQMRQAQVSLAEQEQRYHDLQNATDLIQSVAPDGHFLFVNKKWQDTLGYREDELANLTLFDIIHEESKEHCMTLFPRVIAGENVGIIDVVFKARNGKKVYMEGLANCKISDGKPQYTRGIFKDVTERKKAADELHSAYEKVTAAEEELRQNYDVLSAKEQALRESEERFRNLFDNANESIFVIQDGRICFANPKIVEIGGYANDELAVKPFLEFIHPDDRAVVGEQHGRRLAGEVLKETYAFRILPKEGPVRWMEINASLITWDNRPAVLVFLSDITERRKTENALRDSEERYRALYNDNPVMLFTLDPAGNVISVNKAGAGQLGYTAGELEGQSVLRVFYPDDRSAVTDQFQVCLKSPGKGFHWQFRKVKKDGSLIWVDENAKAMVSPSGELSVLVVCQDITERKRAEEALSQSEKKYRNIIENIQDVVYRTDRNGKLIMFSPHGVKLAGYDSEEEMIGLDVAFDTYMDPKERERFLAALKEKGFVENYPLVLKTKTGKPRIVTASSHFYYDDSGNVLGIEGILHDITDLRDKEQELRASEERYRALYNDNPVMLFTLDPDGIVMSVNKAGASELGYTAGELEGQSVLKVFYPEDHRAVAEQLQVCLKSPGEVFHWQFRKVKKDGSLIWVDEHARAMPDPAGKLSVLVVCQDITGRKQAEEDLRKSEEQYRTIIENIQDVFYRTDMEGNLLFVSPSAATVLGYTTESDFLGKNITQTIYYDPEDRKKFLAELNKSGSVSNYEVKLKKPDGTAVLVSTNSHKYYDAFGKLRGVEGIFRDITDRVKAERDLLKKNEELNAALEELTATEEELRANYEELSRQGQELRASEEKYRLLTEATNDIIYTIDLQGIITHVSPQISRYGYTQKDVISQHFTRFFAEEDTVKVIEDVGTILSTRQPRITLLRALDKSGKRYWMESSGAPVLDHSGSIVAVSGIMRDVTSRKEAEDALRESEEKFRALVEYSLDGILITNFTGKLIFANQAAGNIVDAADLEALIGKKNVLEFVAPESRANVIQDFGKVALGIDAYLVHHKLITETGREIWVECIGKKIPFGGSTAMLVSMRDITERKAAEIERARIERTLQESEEKFRTLVEHSLDGILIVDMTGNILFSNRASAEMVEAKVDPDRTERINALEFVAPESRAGVLQDLSQVAKGIDCYPVHYQAITTSGRRIWVEGIGKRILFQNSPAILVSIRDISSRKRMEEAILRTNKQLSLLSSVTRHDVLNKISVIQGHIALARKQGARQDYPALLDKIESLTNIIKSQVEFTRIYQNLGAKEPEWQKPGRFLSPAILPDSVILRRELGDLEIYADLMLEKVFFNLIDNSLRHGGNVTEIRMQYRKDPEGLTILFEDNGIGIPVEEKERMFERGYGKNTGLGLFLAREILGITGITIRETGEAGKGARFEILVPASAYRIVPA